MDFGPLRQQALYNLAMNVGQSIVATLKTERQLFVVESEEVKQGGMKVMHMDPILHDVESEIIGLSE